MVVIRRAWLDWSGPALPLAARWLIDQAPRAEAARCDLRRVVCVLPGQRAGRLLLAALLEECDAQQQRLAPPEIRTPGQMVEVLAPHREVPTATSCEQILAWINVLRSAGPGTLGPLLPRPPDEGAFLDCELDSLQATADGVNRSLEHQSAIDALLLDRVGSHQAPDLMALPAVLKAAQEQLSGQLTRRGVGAEAAPAGDGWSGAVTPAAADASAPIAGEVNSREDVIRVLDKACDYFSRHEPSSPVPLLLRRAKRLVSKGFMDIIQDIAPDGINQIKTIAGTEE